MCWPGARRHSSIGILGPLGLQQIRRSRGAPGWDCTWGKGSTKVFLIFLKDGSCWLIVRLIRVNILGFKWLFMDIPIVKSISWDIWGHLVV